jgi:hypothetical protein
VPVHEAGVFEFFQHAVHRHQVDGAAVPFDPPVHVARRGRLAQVPKSFKDKPARFRFAEAGDPKEVHSFHAAHDNDNFYKCKYFAFIFSIRRPDSAIMNA